MTNSEFSAPPGQDRAQELMDEAERYNAWLFGRAVPYLGSSVLDFGAGLGTFTEFAARGRSVVAVEPDAGFVEALRRRFAHSDNVRIVEGDDGLLDQLEERFDSIVCMNVLEHIADDRTTLSRFRECLADGGRLMLLVPAHQALFGAVDRNVGHERRYGRGMLRERLERAGFEVVDIRYTNPVGALGWFLFSRLLKRELVPERPLRIYDRLVPVLRLLDALRLPFGLSVWAVARQRA